MKREVLLAIGGASAGFLSGYLLARRRYAGMMNRELEETKVFYARRLNNLRERLRKYEAEADREVVAPVVSIVPTQVGVDEPGFHPVVVVDRETYENVVEELPAVPEVEVPVQDVPTDPTLPHLISADEFAERPEQAKISLTFYVGDEVLVDEREAPITDTLRTIGFVKSHILTKFGLKSDDPHIFYVRNERLGIDFEIARDNRSFIETVLGYGNPTSEPKKIRPE